MNAKEREWEDRKNRRLAVAIIPIGQAIEPPNRRTDITQRREEIRTIIECGSGTTIGETVRDATRMTLQRIRIDLGEDVAQ